MANMNEQAGLLDILGLTDMIREKISSKELDVVIRQLHKAKELAEKREEEARRLEEERIHRKEEKRAQWQARVDAVTSMDLPLDWENIFDSDEKTQGVHTDSIPDALVMSLTTLGRVDIEYISSITGADYKTVISTLKGSIYQNPQTWNECFYKGWETADEYLSGNLMRKWKAAKEANGSYNGFFQENLDAIEKILPPTVASKDIYITLGSPWVPAHVIDDFIFHLFGDPLKHAHCYPSERKKIMESYQTIHDEYTGSWEIPCKARYNHNVAMRQTYGTDKLEALHILERTLNMRTIAVTDEISSTTTASGKKRVINKAETLAAIEKQQILIEEFQKWVWKDPARKKLLEDIFAEKFSCVRGRNFDGSFLDFPTMSKSISLYPYQKNAVARILFSPNTLLAHDVGSGKTYVMIAAGMEMKRMGLSSRNMYVVPNNIIGQWKDIFYTMYPDAKLLCVGPKDFTPGKRDEVLKRMRDEDFDAIIIAYSCFEQIPLSESYFLEKLESQKELVSNLIKTTGKSTAQLRRKHEDLGKALRNMVSTVDHMNKSVYFDELGITRLFVDEAHNFKNVPLEAKASRVPGISSAGSKKCQDMMDKVHLIQKNNDGKGVIFATGTPITNSISDIYIMQMYLQSGELGMLDLQNFDAWIGMFAERSTEFEIDVDTSSYRLVTRFSKFHNLPELTSLLASIADFHQVDESDGIPAHDGYNDALISRTQDFAEYLKNISHRADDVRQGRVSRREDNLLKITSDGRKAALDLRLVDCSARFTNQSKVARCAENAADIYFRTAENRSTQLIFCDTSTPKKDFNIYDELKKGLMALGVPEAQIAYIHDAETEARKTKLFEKVRKGDIRILIGSTFKLGLGVNVQDRLIALHHIDVPWRPADMTQREGRILRQGNINEKVFIYRYITEGSFDAYSWQLLETKQRFISDLLSGSVTTRSGADVEDTVLDYAEVKALAVGNPLIKKRVEAANELNRYLVLQRKLVDSRIRMEKELLELPGRIEHQKKLIEDCEPDLAYCMKWRAANPLVTDPRLKKEESEKRRPFREALYNAVNDNVLKTKERTLMTYRGFSIVLPANMLSEKPYVWLTRQGRYYVELGGTEVGDLLRIDNFLDTLDRHLEKLQSNLSKMTEKEALLRAELAKKENFSEQISKYRAEVEKLDQKLGVEK